MLPAYKINVDIDNGWEKFWLMLVCCQGEIVTLQLVK